MSYEVKEKLWAILKEFKTHAELKVVNELYNKRWYEIDKELASRFKKGDIAKWYKRKRVYWGVITEEAKPNSRYVKAFSTKGTEWTLGGSVIEKVTDPKRILKVLTELKAQGVEIELKPTK